MKVIKERGLSLLERTPQKNKREFRGKEKRFDSWVTGLDSIAFLYFIGEGKGRLTEQGEKNGPRLGLPGGLVLFHYQASRN